MERIQPQCKGPTSCFSSPTICATTPSALGNPDIITPNLDSLVRRGTSFINAHIRGGTHAAVCMPSRAMLHTGRFLFSLEKCGETIPVEHALLGGTLQEVGYRTFGTGK